MERQFWLFLIMRLSQPAAHSVKICWKLILIVQAKTLHGLITLKNGHTLFITELFLSASTWGFCAPPIFQSFRKHLYLEGSISAVSLRWILLKAFRANKLSVHSAGPSSFSAFHLYLGTHCWHLQVWCLCYHSRNDLDRWEVRLVDFTYFNQSIN